MFIIAEVGSNFTNFNDAKDSIAMAKNCLADAVKFQLYSYKSLYGFEGQPLPGELPKEWIPKLKEKADACGIEFMCTAFSIEDLDYLKPFIKKIKIASSDLSNEPLLKHAKTFNMPIFLSCGASSLSDIKIALSLLEGADVTLLYCVSKYPADYVNLFGLDALRQFNKPVGYSCHAKDWYTPIAAWKYHNATVIEKHFKLRDMPTPDNDHSIWPDQFLEMARVIRGTKQAYPAFPDPQEMDMIKRYNRRLIAIRDIAKDESFKLYENYGPFRSQDDDLAGLSGFASSWLHGKLSAEKIKQGTPIAPAMIQK